MSSRDIEAGSAFVRVSLKGLRQASKRFKRWGMDLQRMGLKFGAAGAALALPLANAVKTFASFDDAMRSVKGVTGATDKEFASLTETAKRLGATTSFTAQEVAALMTELGRAGFAPREIEDMTGAVLNLSRATGTEAAQAAGIMSASLRQFGLDASQAGRVSDVLAAAANKSFNTVASLGEALSYAGPVAKDFGLSIEDAVAMLGALGNVGIQGSSAGTALRRMMILSGAEADKLGKIFKTSFRDSGGELMGMMDILEQMNQATADMSREDKIKAFNEAFGLLGITGASAITGSIGSVRELRAALASAGGTAEKTAQEMDAGLGGAFRMAASAIEGAKIALGEALSPIMVDVTSKIQTAGKVVKDFIEANAGAAIAVAATAAALITAGAGFIGLGVSLQIIAFALGGIASLFALIASPIGIVTALVVAQTAAWMRWTESGRQVATALSEGFGEAFDAIKQTFEGVTDALKGGNLELAGAIAMTGLKLAFFSGLQPIREKWIEFNKELIQTFADAAKGLVGVWSKTAKKLSEKFADLGYKMALMVSGEKDYLTDEERTSARDSAINDYFDTAASNATTGIDNLASAIQDNLNAEIAEGEQRINDLTAALDSLKVEAKAAAEAAKDMSGSHAGMGVTGAMAAAGGMGIAGMAAAAAAATLAENAPDTKEKLAGAAGGLMAGQQIGTFSAAAAGAMFHSRTEDAIYSTAETNKEIAKDIREMKRRRNTVVFA